MMNARTIIYKEEAFPCNSWWDMQTQLFLYVRLPAPAPVILNEAVQSPARYLVRYQGISESCDY